MMNKRDKTMITKQDITNLLKSCNITPSDKVTIHCSLKAIGEIENGVDGLIDGFCEYLTEGLFIVPTHTWDSVDKEHPFYDVKTTVPCIGTLAKVAAFRADGVRSLHPTHSVTVFGKNAAEFVKGEECASSPASVGSCLSRLYEENGKVLLVGVGHERNTYLHAIDERLDIPNRLNPEGYEITVKDYNGNLLKTPLFHGHFTAGLNTCVSDFYPNYKTVFERTGAVTYHELGDALVYCCDARKMTDVVAKIRENTEKDFWIADMEIPEEYYI